MPPIAPAGAGAAAGTGGAILHRLLQLPGMTGAGAEVEAGIATATVIVFAIEDETAIATVETTAISIVTRGDAGRLLRSPLERSLGPFVRTR
jgi:hypothetical protein